MSRRWWIPAIAVVAVVVAGTVMWTFLGDGTADSSPAATGPPGEGRVTGTVTDAEGEPVARAMVEPRPVDDPARPIPELAVLTSEEGQYEWKLPAGGYELIIHHDGQASRPHSVAVAADESANCDITVD